MKDVPGELYERPWKNFAHNRNEALDFARDKADYVLIMDADDFLEFQPEFSVDTLDREAYQLHITRDSVSFYRTQLIKMSCPWRWVGVLHEYLTCDRPHTSKVLEHVNYQTTHEGARSQDPQKYLKDSQVLEEALKEEPANTRYVFYLAQSYKDAGKKHKALEWYQKRVAMGGWDEEVYQCLLYMAHLRKELEYPLEEVIDSYTRAFRYRPHRAEAPYFLSVLFRDQGRFDLAYHLITGYKALPKPVQEDILFVQDWIGSYGLDFEMSISSFYVGAFQESLDLCDALLANETVPKAWKDRVEKNRVFALSRVEETFQKCA